jgi:hypothetical protein
MNAECRVIPGLTHLHRVNCTVLYAVTAALNSELDRLCGCESCVDERRLRSSKVMSEIYSE